MLLQHCDWENDVLKSGKPVLVAFLGGWSQPCLLMNPIIEALGREFTVCKVNVQTSAELATTHHLSSFPTFVIFRDGQTIATHVGLTSEATLRREMTEFSRA